MKPRAQKPDTPQIPLPLSNQRLKGLQSQHRAEAVTLITRLLLEAAGQKDVADEDA